jgi:hypothetical protein
MQTQVVLSVVWARTLQQPREVLVLSINLSNLLSSRPRAVLDHSVNRNRNRNSSRIPVYSGTVVLLGLKINRWADLVCVTIIALSVGLL